MNQNKSIRRSPVEIILDALQAGAESTASLLDVFLSGYAESYQKARRLIKTGPRHFSKRWSEEYRKLNHFYSLLSRLKKEGLVRKEKAGRVSIWEITKKGNEKRSWLRKRRLFSLQTARYPEEPDNKLKIVIFDIPEKERHKRSWLNLALKNLGFKMLQKSVLFGKNKIPPAFLKDLREREMLDYVHIFEVTKTGSLPEN